MTGEITSLRYQKKNRDRVSVYLDGRFAFGLPAIVAAELKRGQRLSEAEIESLQGRGVVESAYGRALNYLAYRPRSRAEVIIYLEKRNLLENQIRDVVSRLERAGLVDDRAFAAFWVENRERFRPKGLRALRYELRSKGISDDLIKEALSSIDAEEGAYRAAGRKAQQVSHLDQQTFHRKLVEYLARRGFGYEEARGAAERHWSELAANE
jgi:regulatory protein